MHLKDGYVDVNGYCTHIITSGGWIQQPLTHINEIAICITGNPGLPGFYTEFISELHENLQAKMPVWVIGHLGHDEPTEFELTQDITKVPPLAGHEQLFDLNAQVLHKLKFIEQFVPAHVRIHLIGHSIGSWMILQMLQQQPALRERICKCYLLFPTIERMAESSNGWIFNKLAVPLFTLFGFLIVLYNYLPWIARFYLVKFYCWLSAIPYGFIGTTLKYTKMSSMQKVVYLAKDEMAQVRQLPQQTIAQNLSLLTFYYGTTDGWVPVAYYEQIIKQFPKIDARLDEHAIDHAFVLRYSKPMAKIVANLIASSSDIALASTKQMQ